MLPPGIFGVNDTKTTGQLRIVLLVIIKDLARSGGECLEVLRELL